MSGDAHVHVGLKPVSDDNPMPIKMVVGGGSGRIPVEPLGSIGAAKKQTTSAVSANVALTPTVTRVSISVDQDTYFSVGAVAQTATMASHHMFAGERLDFVVPLNANIAVLQDSSAGTVYISELS